MRRTYERGTKARLNFSGEPHAPVNMADSIQEVNKGGKKRMAFQKRLLRCTALYFIRHVNFRKSLWDFHRLFGSRNSPTTGILHTIRYPPCLQERVARQRS